MIPHLLAQSVTIGGGDDTTPYSIDGPANFKFGGDSIGGIIGKSLQYVFAFAGVILLLMIISSGFTLMLSAGDPKKLAKGRASLMNAIIGFLIIFAAFWLVQIAGVIFGWPSILETFGQ